MATALRAVASWPGICDPHPLTHAYTLLQFSAQSVRDVSGVWASACFLSAKTHAHGAVRFSCRPADF